MKFSFNDAANGQATPTPEAEDTSVPFDLPGQQPAPQQVPMQAPMTPQPVPQAAPQLPAQPAAAAPAPAPVAAPVPTATPQGGASFMMTGQQAAATAKAAENAGGPGDRRFWLKPGEARVVTFLTGALDASGVLDSPATHEHTFKHMGKYHDLVCQQYLGVPCPMCETGDTPSFSTFFVVIDHTVYQKNDGSQGGFMPRLFVAKARTRGQLQEYATEYGGLVGATFKVKRSQGDKIPRVGDVFMYQGKVEMQDLANAMLSLGIAKEEIEKRLTVPQIETLLNNKSPDELRAMGIGVTPAGALPGQSIGQPVIGEPAVPMGAGNNLAGLKAQV